MKKTTLYYLLSSCLMLSNVTYAQNVIDKGKDQLKYFNAHQYYLGENYTAALKIYQELAIEHPNDATVLFHIGACYLQQANLTDAIDNLEKAKAKDPKADENLDLDLGLAYQQSGDIDKAISEFTSFKTTFAQKQSKLTDSRVDFYLNQCNTAKELMAKPVPVKIENMGQAINSEYDDKTPSISADGKTFIFNSRRPNGVNSPVDKEGDGKYFEKVYISKWDTINNKWMDAEMIPGSINDEGHDACCSISPNGKEIFLYKNNIQTAKGGDIYTSKRSISGKWRTPQTLGPPINTSYYEDGACLSPDGKELYFVSERPGGYGHGDIYVSKRISSHEWGKPENLGPVINTSEDEGGVFIAGDGKTLFFSSEGHNSMGSYDIFKSVRVNGKWTTPVNLGYPINTIYKDVNFVIAADGKTGYFASDRKGGLGERDIYQVDLSNYPVMDEDMKSGSKSTGLSILKGSIFDSKAGTPIEADITINDSTGTKVAATSSAAEGDYFITLKGNKKYQLVIKKSGYETYNEAITLPISSKGTYAMAKDILLKKK
ncbi:MAG: tetratricopeptide repeat protein [Bacteroidia bacterium]